MSYLVQNNIQIYKIIPIYIQISSFNGLAVSTAISTVSKNFEKKIIKKNLENYFYIQRK